MGFVLLTELESTGLISCKIKGLPLAEIISLEKTVSDSHLIFSRQEDFFEVDTHSILLLNILSGYNYRIVGQSMVIENSYIGGRTVQIQKICWTLEKKDNNENKEKHLSSKI